MEKTNEIRGREVVAEKARMENSALVIIIMGTAFVYAVGFMVAYYSQSFFLLKLLMGEAILSCAVVYSAMKWM